jgi:hypothetical protein
MDENLISKRESVSDALKKYKENNISNDANIMATNMSIPTKQSSFNPMEYEKTMSRETDPDLITSYEMVKLPSLGLLYPNGLSEVSVEYMTSKDEDLLTTPSLIENGTVINVLLKRKIKTQGVNPDDLLIGDRSAIILFLRTSSYGSDYTVQVSDPRTGVPFKATVDLLKLKYKELTIQPTEQGYFSIVLPMRKKTVLFKLLNYGEDTQIFKKAEAIKEAYGEEFSQYSTMKIKSHIISIDGKTDRSYIDKFVDAMPALDSLTIRRKIQEVSPDIDMTYEFVAKDGYKFNASLSLGIDFFFPNT